MEINRFTVDLSNGTKLIAEKSADPYFPNEIYIGVEGSNGMWVQDLAVIRSCYVRDNDTGVAVDPKKFEVLVYGDGECEDYTNRFVIGVSEFLLMNEEEIYEEFLSDSQDNS